MKFQSGTHVRHKLGTQDMIVIEYEKKMQKLIIRSTVYNRTQSPQPIEYTDNILCGWVDEKNFPQRQYYKESELIEVK